MIRYNGKTILGVDLGNFNMKTASQCFPSAYVELTGNGNNYAHTLQVDGRSCALGGKRVAQRDDKAHEDFLILLMFAIGRELEANGLRSGSYDIYLSTALPPAYLNNREMRSNLKQFFRRQLAFQYNGRRYKINVVKVYVCPQAIAAMYANVLTDRMRGMVESGKLEHQTACPLDMLINEPIGILVDIGGGTVDPVILKHGIPEPFDDENPARGVIWTYNRIRGDIKAKLGNDLTEDAVNMFLIGERVRLSTPDTEMIHEHIHRYAGHLLMELKEKGLPFSTAYTIVQGGGAEMVREMWSKLQSFAMLDFLPEIRATAMGCEVMAKRIIEIAGQKQECEVK